MRTLRKGTELGGAAPDLYGRICTDLLQSQCFGKSYEVMLLRGGAGRRGAASDKLEREGERESSSTGHNCDSQRSQRAFTADSPQVHAAQELDRKPLGSCLI